MTSLPQGTANDNANAPYDIEPEIAALAAALRRAVDKVAPGEGFGVREAEALRLSNEMVRRLLQQDLQDLASSHGDKDLLIDGELHRPHQPGTVTYHSLVGPLPTTRWSYRPVGERNAPTVVPLELAAGLMERATPALSSCLAAGLARGGSRDVVEDMEASHRLPPSRSTIERIGHRLGDAVIKAVEVLEPTVRAKEQLPDDIRAVSVGLDRTSAPMEEDLVEPPHRKPRKKPYVRTPPDPVQVCHRMTYVGTVALHGPDDDSLQTYRYFASAEEGPEGILRRMMDDVRRVRAERRNLPVLVIQDGAPEMWNRVTEALEDEPTIHTWHEVLDRYHLDERLADVAKVLAEGNESEAREIRSGWCNLLNTDDDGISVIHREIELSLNDGFTGQAYDTLHETHTYISNNHERMRYATFRTRGLPIGSGITEAACKTMVMQRAKRSGQRWRPDGLQAVMALRTQLLNLRLGPYLSLLHDTEYSAEVKVAA